MTINKAFQALQVSHVPGNTDSNKKEFVLLTGGELLNPQIVEDILNSKEKENLDYTYNFKSGVKVGVNGEIFEQSFGNREETEDMIDLYEITIQRQKKVIGINGTAHSNKVVSLDGKNLKDKTRLLEAGIDGVIVTNLEDDNKISLILGVADCAPISISNKNGSVIGLVHAGWQGVSKGIIQNLIKELASIEPIKNFSFYIGPMAGDNFEFGEDAFETNFGDFIYNKGIQKEDFYKNGNLKLREIITDIFYYAGVKKQDVNFSDIQTNSPTNSWPSFRLHTKYKSIIEKFKKQDIKIINGLTKDEKKNILKSLEPCISITGIYNNKDGKQNLQKKFLTNIERELFLSDNFDIYSKDPRLALFVEN